MRTEPLVSLLMTAYNREKYIGEAIQSALQSSFTDFELIIVDDGSKDRTVEIARRFAQQDQRVKVFINAKNLGDYPNRNQAAGYARGKYIKYLDADDTIYPWGLEVVVNYMEKFPSASYGLDSIEQDVLRPFPILLTPHQAYYRHYFQVPVFHKAPTSCIIRRDEFIKEKGFSGRRMVGDFEMWLKLSQRHNVLLMPMGIVWSRMHDEQESKDSRDNGMVAFDYSLVELEMLQQEGCPLSDEEQQRVIRRVIRSQARSALRSLLIRRNVGEFFKKLHATNQSLWSCLRNAFRHAE